MPSTAVRKYVVLARGRPPQLSPQLLQVGVDLPPRLAQSGTVDHDLFIAFDGRADEVSLPVALTHPAGTVSPRHQGERAPSIGGYFLQLSTGFLANPTSIALT